MFAKKKSSKKKQPQRAITAAPEQLSSDDKQFMKPPEVAKLLRTTVGHLANWRNGRGAQAPLHLPYIKLGVSVLYDRADVMAFIEAHKKKQVEPESSSLGRAS
jgi:hypothetical protein